jgi:hypothetical protein
MTFKKKKNLGNKMRAPFSGAGSQDDGPNRDSGVVVVDLAAVRRKKAAAATQEISPAAEGLRLVQAFLNIPDPVKRAELIGMVEDYVRRAR